MHQTLPHKKTQRLKSESSGDWQKEKDQNSHKKEGLKKERLQKKEFKKKRVQKRGFKKKEGLKSKKEKP
ncbi:hypothetical protein HpBT025_14630 [Helicobacter pylori]